MTLFVICPAAGGFMQVERALSKLACAGIRKRGYERLASLAGLDLPAGPCWVLTRLARRTDVPGTELARRAGVTLAEGRPYVDRLVAEGMVVRVPAPGAPASLHLTAFGAQAADRLIAARHDGLRDLLADWSPEQHAELADLLNKLSHALLADDAHRHPLSR